MTTRTLEIARVNTVLEYQIGAKEVEGKIFEVEVFATMYGTNIVYHVENENGDTHLVDGTTLKKI